MVVMRADLYNLIWILPFYLGQDIAQVQLLMDCLFQGGDRVGVNLPALILNLAFCMTHLKRLNIIVK